MKNILNALTLFGKELPWELDTALFWLLVAQVALIMFMVIVFAVLIHRVGRRGESTTVVIKEPVEEKKPEEVAEEPQAEVLPFEFPEELQGSWGIEGHDGIRVVIGTSTLSVDGVVATDITATETEGEYAFMLGDVEHTVFLKRARKQEETSGEDAVEDSETDGNLRTINGGDYFYEKLCKWVEPTAHEAEPEPIVITFPDSLRGDWVVEGHESVHVLIEEHTLFIDGIEATDIALDAGKPTEYMFKANGLDYIVAYGTSDEGGFRNISGGEFTACALVEPVEEEAEPEPEKVEYIVYVQAPEGLPVLQIALFNGENQIGSAVTLTDGYVKISAEPGDYTVKLFGLPEGYLVESGALSAATRETAVIITEIVPEEPEEEAVPTLSDIIGTMPEEEVEYNVVVNAPDGLPAMQIALYNGENQIGNAVNVESGAATISAVPGEYTVKLFGVPEGYDITAGTLSESRHICTITVTPSSEVAAATDAAANNVIQINEESFEGGVLRYDKSFTAKLIQSENEVKGWYTDIKNELLSYKRVHARMSWKRESYNLGREAFAKMSFRGNTLCLYLPIDPNSLIDSKYKVESVEDNASYADTPCLYRIKNSKRAKYAKELIAIVAGFTQAEKFERESVDYYLPYEGLVELIKKGLIKRNIKDKNQEAFFEERKQAELLAEQEQAEQAPAEPSEQPAEEVAVAEEVAAVEEVPIEEPAEEVAAAEETPAEEPAEEVATVEEAPAEEPAEEVAATEEVPAEEPAEEVAAVEEAPAEEPAEEVAAVEEAPVEEPAEEVATVEEVPVEEPAEEVATVDEAPVEEPAEEVATVDEVPAEEPAEEVAAVEEAPAEEPAEEVATVEEAPAEEPAEEETEVEELSTQELDYIQSYEEQAEDEDGIEVVGVMFRRRGKKVYWFDPDGQTWKKGEIALYITPDNPPQEVIVVDNTRLSPDKLHLPLKPLCKANRRQ